jgi:hypothetical protein
MTRLWREQSVRKATGVRKALLHTVGFANRRAMQARREFRAVAISDIAHIDDLVFDLDIEGGKTCMNRRFGPEIALRQCLKRLYWRGVSRHMSESARG